jgi:gliding motility-associated lipoprotein GldD
MIFRFKVEYLRVGELVSNIFNSPVHQFTGLPLRCHPESHRDSLKGPCSTTLMRYLKFLIFPVILVAACQPDYTPKPRGFFRIDLPEHAYRRFDTTFPYSFDLSVHARVLPDRSSLAEPYWINIVYPSLHAQVHLSYKRVSSNLAGYLEDCRLMVNKHMPKANAITQQEFLNPEKKVYGLTFAIRGSEAASPFQFYLTDSVSNFVRGALYFHVVPRNDSLAPVIGFIETDIQQMINTFSWKN